MNWKERQDWLKAKYPLTVVMDRYNGTYSGAKFLAFPLGFDEVPIEVDGSDTECAYFWKNYKEPVGKGASPQEAIDDLVAQMESEDEDERIREWLIEECQKVIDIANPAYDTSKAKKAIAWLEKQKCDRMKPIYDARESFESALEKAWKDYDESGSRTVDSCEDDYVECAHAKGFREGFLFGLEKQKEQKPVACQDCAERLKGYISGRGDAENKLLENFGAIVTPENNELRIQARSKSAEWREEDEKMLNILISRLHTVQLLTRTDSTSMNFSFFKEIGWLNSLRNRAIWKPSEKEMNELHEALIPGHDFDCDVLQGLYADLKKLMKEDWR